MSFQRLSAQIQLEFCLARAAVCEEKKSERPFWSLERDLTRRAFPHDKESLQEKNGKSGMEMTEDRAQVEGKAEGLCRESYNDEGVRTWLSLLCSLSSSRASSVVILIHFLPLSDCRYCLKQLVLIVSARLFFSATKHLPPP